jgi:hypothetical protein
MEMDGHSLNRAVSPRAAMARILKYSPILTLLHTADPLKL